MSHSVVEATMSVYFTLNRNAFFDLIETLSYDSYIFRSVRTSCSRPSLVLLLIGSRVELIKVESFDRLLKDLNYLLAGVLLIFRTALLRLEINIINLLIDLTQVFIVALRDAYYLLIPILWISQVAEKYVNCAIVKDDNELV